MATELKMDPDDVLDWRESKLVLWGQVMGRCVREQLLRDNLLLSLAVWNPKKLRETLSRDGGERIESEEVRRILDRAREIGTMVMRPATAAERKRLSKGV